MKYFSLRTMIAAAVIIASAGGASLAFAATTTTTTSLPHPTISSLAAHHTTPINGKTHTPTARQGFGGTVTATSGTTITVSAGGKDAKTYTVDASKAHFMGSDVRTIADIHTGDKVVVMGTFSGTNVVARMVVDRPASEGTPKAFTNAKSHFTKPTTNTIPSAITVSK